MDRKRQKDKLTVQVGTLVCLKGQTEVGKIARIWLDGCVFITWPNPEEKRAVYHLSKLKIVPNSEEQDVQV